MRTLLWLALLLTSSAVNHSIGFNIETDDAVDIFVFTFGFSIALDIFDIYIKFKKSC